MKGSLPMLILYVLSKGPSHGYEIAKRIKEESENVLDFKEGTLYPTLHNLEKQRLIEAYEAKENGRVRRYYRLTDSGHSTLKNEMEAWARYSHAINLIVKENAT
jgi:transcriptional regulator